MEQLRHRPTNVSPKGQTCRADQNPLKRSDLDDLESPAAPSPVLRVACYNARTATHSTTLRAGLIEKKASGSKASPIKTPETRDDPTLIATETISRWHFSARQGNAFASSSDSSFRLCQRNRRNPACMSGSVGFTAFLA